MKYQRSFLVVERRHSQERVPSLAVGEWHIHDTIGAPGLTVSHRSGIAAGSGGLNAVQAIRLIRALSTLPPLPVSDQAFRKVVRKERKAGKQLRAWLIQARDRAVVALRRPISAEA